MLPNSQQLVAKIALFAGLDEATCAEIATAVRWTRSRARTQIISEGDPSTDIFFVAEGAIQAKSFAANGKEVTYIDIHAGGLFGEFSAIDGQARSASIITGEASIIGRMSSAQFRALMLAHPELHMRVTELLVGKVRDLSRRVFEFSTLNVCGRIHAELIRLLDGPEGHVEGVAGGGTHGEAGANGSARPAVIEPAPTHQELASRISTHREAVTRELNYLAKIGLLTLGRRRIEIHDLDRLRRMGEALHDA